MKSTPFTINPMCPHVCDSDVSSACHIGVSSQYIIFTETTTFFYFLMQVILGEEEDKLRTSYTGVNALNRLSLDIMHEHLITVQTRASSPQ